MRGFLAGLAEAGASFARGCMQNFSPLASKLREETEMTGEGEQGKGVLTNLLRLTLSVLAEGSAFFNV